MTRLFVPLHLRYRLAVLLAMGLTLLSLSACQADIADALQSGSVMAIGGLNGRWFGPVTPTVAGCAAASTGLMTIGGGSFAFDPFQGTTVLDGTVKAGGTLDGRYVRQVGAQSVSITFAGSATSKDGGTETIQGRLVSGPCIWSVILKRG